MNATLPPPNPKTRVYVDHTLATAKKYADLDAVRRERRTVAMLVASLVLVAVLIGWLGRSAYGANTCGGNSTVHTAPIDCTNTLTLSGVTGTAHLTVDTGGHVHVAATVNNPNVQLYLQVKAHQGVSSNGGFVGQTAVFVNGAAAVDLTMPACTSQIDTKIVPGVPTLDHVDTKYRVAAPLVGLPNCTGPTTTSQTTTTTSPTTTVTTTTVTVTTSVPGTPASSPPSSVPGTSPGSLPPTGSGPGVLIGRLIAVLLVAGTIGIVLAGRRNQPAD